MKTTKYTLSWIAAIALATLSLPSCSNYSTPERNAAATGALIGAGAGAAVNDEDRAEGAAAGAAIGAGAGYLYEKNN